MEKAKGPEYYEIALKYKNKRCYYAQSPFYVFWWTIADRIQKGGYKTVLEFGCGTGQLAHLLRDTGIENYRGFDFAELCIQMCMMNSLGDYEFVVDDVRTTTAFDDYPYDVCVSTEVLEHLDDDLAVLDKIRPGTRCFMSVPNLPGDSHVRLFNCQEEVLDRYGDRFRDICIDSYVICGVAAIYTIYLLDGIKNGSVDNRSE